MNLWFITLFSYVGELMLQSKQQVSVHPTGVLVRKLTFLPEY